jgi:hypothetical protein
MEVEFNGRTSFTPKINHHYTLLQVSSLHLPPSKPISKSVPSTFHLQNLFPSQFPTPSTFKTYSPKVHLNATLQLFCLNSALRCQMSSLRPCMSCSQKLMFFWWTMAWLCVQTEVHMDGFSICLRCSNRSNLWVTIIPRNDNEPFGSISITNLMFVCMLIRHCRNSCQVLQSMQTNDKKIIQISVPASWFLGGHAQCSFKIFHKITGYYQYKGWLHSYAFLLVAELSTEEKVCGHTANILYLIIIRSHHITFWWWWALYWNRSKCLHPLLW